MSGLPVNDAHVPDTAEWWDLSRGRVIEASAGTGKTYTITTLVCRLVAEQGLEIGQVLVTTFTNAAAAELRARIRARMAEVAQALRVEDAGGAASSDRLVERWLAEPEHVTERRERLERAMHAIDQAVMTTIHGFCQRTLAELPFEFGVDIGRQLVDDGTALREAVLADAWAEAVAHLPPEQWTAALEQVTPAVAEQVVSAALREPDLPVAEEDPATQADPAQAAVAALRVRLVEVARRFAQARKARMRCMTFDDMLHDVLRALRGPHGATLCDQMRARYQVVLVDEFQDTDRVQSEIFRRMFIAPGEGEAPRAPKGFGGPGGATRGPARVFFIGDPKQSIYLFRGADIGAYQSATTLLRAGGGGHSSLGTSYRTDRVLLDAVQGLLEGPGQPGPGSPPTLPGQRLRIELPRLQAKYTRSRLVDAAGADAGGLRMLHTMQEENAPSGSASHLTAAQVYARTAAAIRAELAAGLHLRDAAPVEGQESAPAGRPLTPGDMAVLLHTNAQVLRMQRALRAHGIPTALRGRNAVWCTDEAWALERILCALATPASLEYRRGAAATELVGLDATAVRALGTDAGEELTRWLLELDQCLRSHGPVPFVRRLLDEPVTSHVQPARLRILARLGGERTITNLEHLSELLEHCRREGIRTPGELAARLALERARNDEGLGDQNADAVVQRIEGDGGAVELLTVHTAKGREWPVVWLPLYAFKRKSRPPVDPHGVYPVTQPGSANAGVDTPYVLAVNGPLREQAAREYRQEEDCQEYRLLYVALTRARCRCNVVWCSAHQQGNRTTPLAAVLHGDEARAKEALSDVRRMGQDLQQLQVRAQRNGLQGRVELVPLPRAEEVVSQATEAASARSTPPAPETLALAPARVLARELPEARCTVSFTAMTRGAHAVAAAPDPGVERLIRADDAEAGEAAAPEPHAQAPLLSRTVLPAGPAYGDLVHRIMERGLRTIDEDSFPPLVEQLCRVERMHADVQALASGLRAVVRQQLLDAPTRGVETGTADLRALTAGMVRVELSYLLPMADEPGAEAVTIERLAEAFRRGGAIAQRYAERVRALQASELRGHLVGFIDLVCRHGERWYVLDYKTNALGTTLEAFAPRALDDAMLGNHYVLQYHLYALAVHRWLRTRVAGYDYERHFGGALYLFMRGMGPARPAGSGVFADRPSAALMDALDAVFAGRALGRAAPESSP